MVTASDEETDNELVRCEQCTEHVWVRRDRLEKHIQKVHSPTAAPRKSFTTYHAHLASGFPPRMAQQGSGPKPNIPALGSIRLSSRRGRRIGAGRCAECGAQVDFLWHYAESSQGAVDICGECKSVVFGRSFGKLEMEAG